MKVAQIIDALGVRVLIERRASGYEIGDSPDSNAAILRIHGETVVLWRPSVSTWLRAIHSVLHEAVHVVLGPDSLEDESVLMAYQWALTKLAGDPAEYKELREGLASYVFEWVDQGEEQWEVTMDDAVFSCLEWVAMDAQAIAAGVLVQRPGGLAPVFGFGPHPGWPAHIRVERRWRQR